MNQQEKRELELRYRKFGLNCDYLMRTKTEKELDHFLTFRAHKAIHRSSRRR